MRKIFRNNAQGIVDALTKIIAKKGRGTRILEKINLANPNGEQEIAIWFTKLPMKYLDGKATTAF